MPLVVTHESNGYSETDLTTYTFSGQDIGTAAADRRVVVATHAEGGGLPVSVTIGGNAATLDVSALGGNGGVGIFSLVVAVGTTADVVVVWTTQAGRCGIGVWTITGSTWTPVTDSDTATSGTVLTLGLDVAAGAGGISAVTSVGDLSFTWVGTVEVYDTANAVGWREGGAGLDPTTTDRDAHVVTATLSGSGSGQAAVVAVWAAAYPTILLLGAG